MKDITYVDFDKVMEVVVRSRIPYESQRGFVKVQGPTGRNVYVALTQRVGRVDISGFSYDGEGVTELGDMSHGNVRQRLDFSLPEEQILGNLGRVLEHMSSLPPVERGARSRVGRGTGQEAAVRGRPRPPTYQPEDRPRAQADQEPAHPRERRGPARASQGRGQ